MKIITWNVNGIRSCHQKGFSKLIEQEKPDVLCLQEIKAQTESFPADLMELPGYQLSINAAQKRGYAGTAIYVRASMIAPLTTLGLVRFEQEGRIQIAILPQVTVINLYMPHGGRKKEHLDYKIACYQQLFSYLREHKDENIILCGDFNIAHTEIDLARPKGNKNNIMFTPTERALIDELISLGYTDTFRYLHPEKTDTYTWWPYAFDARNRNIGWRIDYIFTSQLLNRYITAVTILDHIKGSDHCPVAIDLVFI